MTDHNPRRRFQIGGRDLVAWLSAERPAFVEAVLGALVARVPGYGQLPDEELRGDIYRVIDQNLNAFVSSLIAEAPPTGADLARVRESAARRAEEGIPIEMVLSAYHLGVQAIWDTIASEVLPEDLPDVMRINALALQYLEQVSPAVAAGYLEEHQAITGDEDSARHTLLTALLEGEPAEDAARLVGLRLPERYLVLSITIGLHPDELCEAVDPEIAARRKLRRVRAELVRQAGHPVLAALRPAGGTALIARTTPADRLCDDDWVWVTEIAAALNRAAGAAVMLGATIAKPPRVHEAAVLASEVRDVAQEAGLPPSAYRLDDVLLEYQMARPGAARERLATVLDPLAGNTDLFHTLVTFLRLGGRRATAAALQVQPNSIDYRLGRVQSLTGLDPTNPTDIPMLRAALAARRIAEPA